MANSDLSSNENILVKVDQNNLIYIDPNSVVDNDGNILPRSTIPENLVIYANLEADIIPRSILSATNDQNTLVSIARGTFNFLSNQDGRDYDTSWTDAFTNNVTDEKNQLQSNQNQSKNVTPTSLRNYDDSGQSFGIDNISIQIKGANSIPTVTINFIDVRGKTLFESPANSPYNAFFHIPWPLFYLTLKGYYGKAIRYRLHLVKFSSKFSESTGNFEITTIFVGSTFAYLNDIPLKAIMNCPYMFSVEAVTDGKTNTIDNTITKVISKSSRGYTILNSIYSEYKKKGLVKPGFPTITLRELINKAQSLDKILEREILDNKLHADIFVGLQDFESKITTFFEQASAWGKINLVNVTEKEIIGDKEIDCYNLKDIIKNSNKKIVGKDAGTLEYLILNNNDNLKNSKLFTDELIKAADSNKTGGGNFRKTKLLAKLVDDIKKYYRQSPENSTYQVKIDLLIDDINEIYKTFNEEREKIEKYVEEEMNEIIKNPEKGFGFQPTIRNIFAIILANADVYIRLMKEVHKKAFDQSDRRKDKLKTLSKETKGDGAIYPWPEVKKEIDNKKSKVIAYPGEKTLISKLQSDDATLWPEVDFVEQYIEVGTNKSDPNVNKENNINKTVYVFENDNNTNNTKLISTLEYINNIIPYVDRTPSSVLYEIYERANYYTLIDTFNNETLRELSSTEYLNISDSFSEDNELITLLNQLVTGRVKLFELLKSFSAFERYPYYEDQIPTIQYIKDSLDSSHQISEYNSNIKKLDDDKPKLQFNLETYKTEEYRKHIYPFNSETYLSYINKKTFDESELNFKGLFSINSIDGFILTPNSSTSWFKTGFVNKHLFSNKLKVNNTEAIILNTPYFHKQLYDDFLKTSSYGKYAGSAYLLLNSLPYLDLDDKIDLSNATYESVRMSSLFKEIGATHFVPYHLICKWGSIYHRYKKYILEGSDILDGVLNVNNLTTAIDSQLFFNNNESGTTFNEFTSPTGKITYSAGLDVGVHPYYDAIYHQVINDYNHYIITSGDTSFSQNVIAKGINLRNRKKSNNLNYWTSYVDNTKYNSTDKRYTLLPSDGDDDYINKKKVLNTTTNIQQIQTNIDTFETSIQNYYKVIWEDDYINDNFENRKLPGFDEYFKTYSTDSNLNSLYSVDSNYRKIIDLLGTFSPNILEDFEDIFLKFASERTSNNINQRFPNVKYTNFQNLLKEVVSVSKQDDDSNKSIDDLIKEIIVRQNIKLNKISNDIKSTENTVKITIGNPKEINYHVWHGFTDMDNINRFSYNDYFNGQLTNDNKNYIKLYLGEDIDSHYQNFFLVNNVELNETNILQFRPLIYIYAGYVKNGGINSKTAFQDYIKINILNNAINRRDYYLDELIKNFRNLKVNPITSSSTKIVSGYETDVLKVELYNFFKSFNDKWIGGNSIGQRLLLEEFLFLDKANKDIGDELFLNLDRISELGKQDYDKTNLYSVISVLIQNTGIDMRPMPAYVNFYGTNYNNKTKITPSKKVAKILFGSFLDVDYQESSPKIILQLVGPNSKHIDNPSKKYKFVDDSFNVSDPNNNPIIITPDVFSNVDLSKSNRAVAFEVSFGDQNQGIFKGVQLDQTTLKNTTESFVVLENIARSESGAGAYNVDIGLFDYYRQASYTCDVTCMGNVMIQPTMFFYLKNIPMFKGSYWITEVSHSIRGNNFTTTFKGTRIPYASLPDPKDSFVSSYRVLFDRLRKNSIQKQNLLETGQYVNSKNINFNGKTYSTNVGNEFPGEDFDKIKVSRVGVTEFGIPYNGYDDLKTIQLVKYRAEGEIENEWLRASVFEYGSTINFQIPDDSIMNIVTYQKQNNIKKVLWSEIKKTNKNTDFYSVNPVYESNNTKIRSGKTIFTNPLTKEIKTVTSSISGNEGSRIITGPIDTYVPENFGIGLSYSLMKSLKLKNGSIVYFRMI